MSAQTNTFNDSLLDGVAATTGAGDDTWETATNWSLGIIPTAAHDVVIPDGMLAKIKVAGALANSITASGTGKLQINAEKSLNVTNNVTSGSNSNILFVTATGKSMGTLIFGGTFSGGNITAKMRLPSNDDWHLISSPLKQATINNYVTNATTIVTNGSSKYSLASYNDANAAGLKYTYFPNPLPNTTDKLEKGQGYSTKLNNTGDITKPDVQFKGKLVDADFTIAITDGGNGFNLMGNPFTTYLFANTAAHATNNVLALNSGILDEATLWFWDNTAGGGTGDWITKNLGDFATYHISPVQGFFVKAKTGGGAFKFQETMQTHAKTDGFYKTSKDRFEIDLLIATDDVRRSTSIRYTDNSTTSFDSGYDSSLFGGYSSEFALYTQLVKDNTGKKLAIQSLPNANLENMIISVGVNAKAGSEITFRADVLNVPAGYNVYLEDRTNKTLIRLDETDATYKTTVSEAVTNGRFYIHTRTSSVLGLDATLLNSVSIYKTSNSNLKITGLTQGESTVSLYNLLGKRVMTTSFEAANTNNVSLPSLSTGVYIVKLQSDKGTLNKKIILE
ncbi:hypothetical protein BTO07_06595 [Polaribacter sp. SA4-12]|nr:hypothetical protein BTO07_06595 [Polaribacter sp. SA4-12]